MKLSAALVLCAAFTAFTASATTVGTRKANLAARTWLKSHQQPDGDELDELKGENPEAYAIVKALLTKRALGLLDPRHPSASFAPSKDQDVPTGAAAFAKFQDGDAKAPVALAAAAPAADSAPSAVGGASGGKDWLNWKPPTSAMDMVAQDSSSNAAPSSSSDSSTGSFLGKSSAVSDSSAGAQAASEAAPAAPEENSYLKNAGLSPTPARASMAATKNTLSTDSHNYLASFSWDDDDTASEPTHPSQATQAQPAKAAKDSAAPQPAQSQTTPPKNSLLAWLGGNKGAKASVAKAATTQPPHSYNSYLNDLQ